MQRPTKSWRPSFNSSTLFLFPAIAGVTTGAGDDAVSQPSNAASIDNEMAAATHFISKCVASDGPKLKLGLIPVAGCLREGRDGYPPSAASDRKIGADKKL